MMVVSAVLMSPAAGTTGCAPSARAMRQTVGALAPVAIPSSTMTAVRRPAGNGLPAGYFSTGAGAAAAG
ncbi:MAG: hypothetical protein JWR24_1893 [Actinoallomurus sp.]|jgi:hypothetical protein|nr:hypothetical protein [Actinoallomurus sp.]